MFMSLIEKRRSIRKFQEREVEAEKIRLLMEAILRAPSSMGSNPWEFIFVSDGVRLEKLSYAKPHGSAFLRNAAMGVVVCGDPDKSTVWIEDCSIASIFLQLAAESLGLGSCWIQIRERMHDDATSAEAYISDLLNIPPGLKVVSIIAIGYPDEKKKPHTKESLQFEKIHLNVYGKA